MRNKIVQNLAFVREKSPLIYHPMTSVVADFVTNGLLAIGSSPLMTNADDELEEMIRLSSSVVINIEMINHENKNRYSKVATVANKIGKPVILDSSGADLTPYRTGVAHQLLLSHKIDIVRGNASEILAISGHAYSKKSSTGPTHTQEVLKAGKALSERHSMCVVMSGKEDVIIVKDQHRVFDYGHLLMPRVSGIGFLLTFVLAAFHAVDEDPLTAASSGVVIYGMAGEIAATKPSIQGPGTFIAAFLDVLHGLEEQDIEKCYRHG